MSSPATQSAPLARPGRWIADCAACTVTFAVRNFGIRTVTGQLTVKDVTSPVRLDVSEVRATSPDPASPVSLRATGSLDRRTAGITAGPAFLIGHPISLWMAAGFSPASR
jgi:polyisoprenoid-binding protein YceI